ncbi:prepilin-type N-terminal cleavage/methylation domain-containing protein [Planctomycetales bacterium ZRK34]|nr:prepilin-type N-terminal cleavage/methylation domain-containing protein [Planctomycetales bacterium ZRK34]
MRRRGFTLIELLVAVAIIAADPRTETDAVLCERCDCWP